MELVLSSTLPVVLVATDNCDEAWEVADFLSVVHGKVVTVRMARTDGYWIMMPEGQWLDTALKVASWLYGVKIIRTV